MAPSCALLITLSRSFVRSCRRSSALRASPRRLSARKQTREGEALHGLHAQSSACTQHACMHSSSDGSQASLCCPLLLPLISSTTIVAPFAPLTLDVAAAARLERRVEQQIVEAVRVRGGAAGVIGARLMRVCHRGDRVCGS
jgi:hypothetical protein